MKITDVRRQLRRWRASNPRVSALLTPVSAASGAVTERGDARARDVATRSAERLVADAAPQSRYVGVQQVPLRRLDPAAAAYVGDARNLYLKVDTQGYEAAVLRGATLLLARARGVQLEMSLVPLYGGQELWDHFLDFMRAQGFVPWTLLPGFVDDATGRTLQIDAVFLRP